MTQHDRRKIYKIANPAAAKAMRERARSNAAGTHLDKRDRRARTRETRTRRAVRDSDDTQ